MGCVNSRNASANSGPLSLREIQERIVASAAPETCSTGSVDYQYAYLSQRGYYPDSPNKANQDSFFVSPNFNGRADTAVFMVFDGHGFYGDKCAIYIRDNLPGNLAKLLGASSGTEAVKTAIHNAFLMTNDQLYEDPSIKDDLSGTTCICVVVIAGLMYVANVGDSRAIVVRRQAGGGLQAVPLSSDQTPYRRDERDRVKAAGARVMTMGQIDGTSPPGEDYGNLKLGDQLDEDGDPPRVWSKLGDFPGTAFTRSFGDSEAEKLGVFAEPEIDVVPVTADDAFICVASDGVFEFLTNQAVADIVCKHDSPLEANRVVVQESYQAWLDLEYRTDDITIITAFVTGTRQLVADATAGTPVRTSEQSRPVRRQANKKNNRGMVMVREEGDDSPFNPEDHRFPKSEMERAVILATLAGSFIFQHTSDDQRNILVDAFQKQEVTDGQCVIQQGDVGDKFYIVHEGVFEVRMALTNADFENGGGPVIHQYHATSSDAVKPSFGELALMYSKKRAAYVYAAGAGTLWSLDRRVFRHIMIRSTRQTLVKSLRRVAVLKALSATQTQRLCDIMSEARFEAGDYIIRQGDIGDTFYIVMEGTAAATMQRPGEPAESKVMDLGPGDYFGERALLLKEPRAANIVALQKCTCLQIGKAAFEEVLGPLQPIIDEDRKRREYISANWAMPSSLDELRGKGIVHQDDFGAFQSFASTGAGAAVENSAGKLYTLRLFVKADVVESEQTNTVLAEVETLRKLRVVDPVRACPVLQKLLTTFSDANNLYVVFSRILVCNLGSYLAEVGPGSMDLPTVKHIVACVSTGIAVLHEAGYLFRGVSSGLLYIDQQGLVVLSDFRFAKQDIQGFTMVGVPEYMSPEQVSHKGYGPAGDWWALGILVAELLTGSTPFADEQEEATLAKIIGHEQGAITVPDAKASAFINALLHPQPDQRLGSAAGLNDVIQHPFFSWFGWGNAQLASQAPSTMLHWVNERKRLLLQTEDVMESSAFAGDQGVFADF